MAHPSSALPNNIYILNGTNDLTVTAGTYVFAIYNPTASQVTVDLTGAINTYQTDAYKQTSSEVTGVPIPSGGTIYGRFTNVGCSTANVVCYLN
jgi:hypothetical protein